MNSSWNFRADSSREYSMAHIGLPALLLMYSISPPYSATLLSSISREPMARPPLGSNWSRTAFSWAMWSSLMFSLPPS